MQNNRRDRGFSLMEIVVVLAVIAILSAILTPIVSGYVDRARFGVAQNDLKNIASALVKFNTDTRLWPIYIAADDIPNGDAYEVLFSEGEVPAFAAAGWTTSLTSTSLETVLNTNYLSLPTDGNAAWQGVYLLPAVDPWGNRYHVTAQHLKPTSTSAAYVLSAGPNQTIDTAFNQPRKGTITVGDDDLVLRIQ